MLTKYAISLFLILALSACSSDKSEDKESTTEKVSQAFADKAMTKINVPLDKAKQAAERIEGLNRQTKEITENMD